MPHRIPQAVSIRVPLKGYLTSDHLSDAVSMDPAVVISKNGAGFGNPHAGATVATEVGGAGAGNGWYYVDLDGTDTGTLGPLIIRATHATMDPIEIVYQVVNANNMGLAALPNAAADGAGGLPVSDAGGLDLDTFLGRLDATVGSRSTYAGGAVASVTAAVTVTPAPPTAAQIRSEIDANSTKLDAAVSTRSSHSAADVWAAVTRTLSAFEFTVATNSDSNVVAIKAQTDLIPAAPAAVGSAMTLTVGERTAVVDALLRRKITPNVGGWFDVWDEAGTTIVYKLVPTTDAAALPITGMVGQAL
jgi:hypothetical protein